jgi:hypothetical protein
MFSARCSASNATSCTDPAVPSALADPWQRSQGSFCPWCQWCSRLRVAIGLPLELRSARMGPRERWPGPLFRDMAASVAGAMGQPGRETPASLLRASVCAFRRLAATLPGGHGTPWTRKRSWRLSAARLPRPTCGARASSRGPFRRACHQRSSRLRCDACNRVPVEQVTIGRFELGHPTAEFRTAPAPSQSTPRQQGQRHRGHRRSSR